MVGTSKSNSGPGDRIPLLPRFALGGTAPGGNGGADAGSQSGSSSPPTAPAADPATGPVPGPATAGNIPRVAGPWQLARTALTSVTRRGGSGGRMRRAATRYVRAKGGARRAAAQATSGRASTARLGGFLSDVAARGFAEAARSLGLEVIGQAADVVLAAILNAIAPAGNTDDDATARRAINETLCDLMQRHGAVDGGVEQLNALTADGVKNAIQSSVSAYVYQCWLLELSKQVEQNAVSADRAVRLEREVRVYVRDLVKLNLQDRDVLRIDWAGTEGRRFTQDIYEQAYGLLGR